MSGSVISTNKAQCRDCYRCVRTCQVKAVRVRGAQAEVVPERCIECGRCVLACPQHAKQIRDDLGTVQEMIAAGQRVVASVAPSVPAFLDVTSFSQVRSLLRQLGFADASETAIGAQIVADEYNRLFGEAPGQAPAAATATQRAYIATACPVIVSLVERYHPDLIPNLAPIVSPMIAHGRWLKAHHGPGTRVVFIGPCAAKKGEAEEPEVADAVDAVLSFNELARWLADRQLVPSSSVPEETGEERPARLFPVGGGLLRAARLDASATASETVVVTGLTGSERALDAVRLGTLEARLVELMACPEGCINGPAMPDSDNVFIRRQRILRFARRRESIPVSGDGLNLRRTYRDRSLHLGHVPDDVIEELLARIEKYGPEDELNCSACGYQTCREKAEATYFGMAEIGMCMPYMRRRAESLANLVMDVVPSAIVVLDSQLRIQEVSPSAEALLGCRRPEAVGRLLADFLPTDTFEEVRQTGRPVLGRKTRYRDDLIVKEFIVLVSRSNLIVSIIEDITREEVQQAELIRIREATIEQAHEVIDKQIRVAHEIASLLGETTAETKVQLTRMIEVIRGRENGGGRGDRRGGGTGRPR